MVTFQVQLLLLVARKKWLWWTYKNNKEKTPSLSIPTCLKKNDFVSHHQKAGEEEADDGAGLRARHDEGGHGGPLTLRGPPGQHAGDAGEGGRLKQSHDDPDDDEVVRVASLPSQLGSAWYEQTKGGLQIQDNLNKGKLIQGSNWKGGLFLF